MLVCDGQGRLTMLDTALATLATGHMPATRDPWFTASCHIGDTIVIGDRCGGVHFIRRSGDQLVIEQSHEVSSLIGQHK